MSCLERKRDACNLMVVQLLRQAGELIQRDRHGETERERECVTVTMA